MPARDAAGAVCSGRSGHCAADRRAGLSRRAGGGLHRGSIGRNAQGRRGQRASSSSTPSAASITKKPTRTCGQERWPRGAPDSAPSSASARARTERENGRALAVVGTPGGWFGARWCDSAQKCLVVAYEPVWAIWHRADPRPLAMSPRCMGISGSDCPSRLRGTGAGHPHSLRRIGEAVECQGADERREMLTVRWSAVRGSKTDEFLAIRWRLPLVWVYGFSQQQAGQQRSRRTPCG